MRLLAVFVAAGLLGLLATVAMADSVPPDGLEGFWLGDPVPGNSWTTPVVFGITDVQAHNGAGNGNGAVDWWRATDYNFQIVALPVPNPTPIAWNTSRLGTAPTWWNPLYMGTSQSFETNPPNAATDSARTLTETQFGVDQMEIHASGTAPQTDWINLPLELGQWTGGWVAGSPSFVLQMQAYNRYGALIGSGDLYFIGGSTYWGDGGEWDGRSADENDGRAKAPGYYESLGVGAWEADAPLPEPLTMAGVFMGIGGLAGYLRKRRAA